MKRRCGGANMGCDKRLPMVGNENGGRRGRYSGIMEMVCSRLWLAQPTVVGAANGDNERWHGEDGKVRVREKKNGERERERER